MENLGIRKIHTRLMIGLLPITFILLYGLAYLMYIQGKDRQLKQMDTFSMDIADARADEVSMWLNGLTKELKSLAKLEAVKSGQWDVMQDELKKTCRTAQN